MSGKGVAIVALVVALLGAGAGIFAVSQTANNQSQQPATTTPTTTQALEGPVGPQGERGLEGPQGVQGEKGVPSNGGTGSRGATGATGTNGQTGAKGDTGAQGASVQTSCINGTTCVGLQDTNATVQTGNVSISGDAKSDTVTANRTYERPNKLMIYYGIPQGVNGLWNNDGAAQTFSRWDYVVFGTGLQDPGSVYHASTVEIVSKMRTLNKQVKVFGYINIGVSIGNQPESELRTEIDQWKATGVDHIFFDLAGYDYNVPRARMNALLDYAHSKGMQVMVNAWVPADVMGNAVNATYNPTGAATHINSGDVYLLESWIVHTTAYASHNGYATTSDLKTRADSAVAYRSSLGVKIMNTNIMDLSTLNDEQENKYFKMIESASILYSMDGYGFGPDNYSATAPNSNVVKSVEYDPDYAKYYNASAPYTINGPWTEMTRQDTGHTFHNDYLTNTHWYSSAQTNQLKVINIDTLNNDVGIGVASPTGKLHVTTSANGTTTVVVQAKVGQTADLLSVQNSGGTPLVRVAVDGTLTASGPGFGLGSNTRAIDTAITQSATTLAVSFGTAYPNANYAVLCTPNYATTCYVTGKSTGGFTLNFGTAAPASASVSWMAIR
jgi:hypothetical protein